MFSNGSEEDVAESGIGERTSWVASGDQRLYFRSVRPANLPWARVLVLHGYGDHSGRFLHLMRWLAEQDVASDAFDFRGHGRSSGRRGFVRRWGEFLEDVRAAIAHVERLDAASTPDALPLFVLGHSHGGLVAAAAGVRGILPPSVRGVVLSAPYLGPAQPLSPMWRVFARVSNLVMPTMLVPTGLSADMMSADPAMVADSQADRLLLRSATPRWYQSTLVTQRHVMDQASAFEQPLLCLIGDADAIADASAAERFVEGAGSGAKRFVLLPGNRHEILRETTRLDTFWIIRDWMKEQAA